MCKGVAVILERPEFRLRNGTNVKVADLVNTTSEDHRSGQTPESIVVKFFHLSDKLEPFLPDIPHYVSILKQICEWKKIPMLVVSSPDENTIKIVMEFYHSQISG